MMRNCSKAAADEGGATAIEYGLIAGAVALLHEARNAGAWGQRMDKIGLVILLTGTVLGGCVTSQTQVLPGYSLENGQRLQDVVTVGTDREGGAPVVTVVNVYDVSKPRHAHLVSHDAASSPGIGTVVAGGLAGAIPHAAAAVGVAAVRDGVRTVVNTKTNVDSRNANVNTNESTSTALAENNNTSINVLDNSNQNTNDNTNTNANANVNQNCVAGGDCL